MSLQVTNPSSESPTVSELRLADYKPPSHMIDKTDLTFELHAEDNVVVSSRLAVRPNPKSTDSPQVLVLKGARETAPEGSEAPTMQLLEIKLNGHELASAQYTRQGDKLTLKDLPSQPFLLEVKTHINPQANRSLNGLYTSGTKLTTQCESEGFRNITFYLDRPDVMSKYTTTIIAPQGKYAQLLSNGNPGQRSNTQDGREQITWHDPFKKPSYLFALVAGNLAVREDSFLTRSGRQVQIHLYVDHGDEDKIEHALASLKRAMKWDEERFGLEYDLDLFQIVAVNDFNFGAMENKGLNIFNSSAILADPKTATDARYEYVEAVVAHEYFHNWSGNRVTLQKWFDLTLKEGLTVFRDSEFTADLNSRAVKRIDDVTRMRLAQFPEDAGAMAHPIRPASVGSIENFYTPTVYEKGAEVIRMIHTMIGETAFRKGTDLYFETFDGQAVTTDDFIWAMEKASGLDLSQFKDSWYNQAGTPTLEVSDSYHPESQQYRLTLRQSTPATPGQPVKKPFHIPVRIGLLDAQGNDLPLHLEAKQKALLTNHDILNLKEEETTFVFQNIPEKPTPSLLRNWSAPVKLNYDYSRDSLTFLMASDSDGFNRWEAGQKLAVDVLKELVTAQQSGAPAAVDNRLLLAFEKVLQDEKLDPALAARALSLPGINYLAELYPDGQVDLDAIHAAWKQAQEAIGKALEPKLLTRFHNSRSAESKPYEWNVTDSGERAIKNLALSYLIAANPKQHLNLAISQFEANHNITDIRAGLRHILNEASPDIRKAKVESFYQAYQDNPLTIQQWFQDQALAEVPDVLEQVRALLKHPDYDSKNPNNIRSLVGGFASNILYFHQKDGSGYAFLAEQIIQVDKFNPSVAAGLTKRLATPHKYDWHRQALIQKQLEHIQNLASSANVKEIVAKSLDLLASKQAEALGS